MATLKLLERLPRGSVTKCQWEDHPMPDDYDVYLAQGPTGTYYLVCIDCAAAYGEGGG